MKKILLAGLAISISTSIQGGYVSHQTQAGQITAHNRNQAVLTQTELQFSQAEASFEAEKSIMLHSLNQHKTNETNLAKKQALTQLIVLLTQTQHQNHFLALHSQGLNSIYSPALTA